MTLTLILGSDLTFDKTIIDQTTQDTVQRLFCYAQNPQQVVNSRTRRAVDKVNCAVMRAAISLFRQHTIRICGKPTIGKEHCLNTFAKLFIRQKQQVWAAHFVPVISHISILLSCDNTSVLLTFQESIASQAYSLRNFMTVSVLI